MGARQKLELGFNVDHVATLRQARYPNEDDPAREPNLLRAALSAEDAGADSITVHLREDRRHAQDEDILTLRCSLRTRLNLEMSLSEEICEFALEVKPAGVCLVPERREELTTEGGLDVLANADRLETVLPRLRKAGSLTSIFIEADQRQIHAAAKLGADAIEIHTGKYANLFAKFHKINESMNGEALQAESSTLICAKGKLEDAQKAKSDIARKIARNKADGNLQKIETQLRDELERMRSGAILAAELGLRVHAGHGLTLVNLPKFLQNTPRLRELNIGHHIVSEAIFSSLPTVIKKFKKIMADYHTK